MSHKKNLNGLRNRYSFPIVSETNSKEIIVEINYSTCSAVYSYIFVLVVFHFDLSILFSTTLLHPSTVNLSSYPSYKRL